MELKRVLVFIAVCILIFNLAYYYPRLTGKGFYEAEKINVTKAIDGDTLEYSEGDIRLLCINTPEKNKPFYEEAKAYLSELEGEEVTVLRDKEDLDKYNRRLRFVFYGDRFINQEIVENGLASVYMCEGLRYESELKKAEEKARAREIGLWKKSESKCASCLELIKLEPVLEYFILKNRCDFECKAEAKDDGNHFFDVEILGNSEKVLESSGKVWNDDGDRLFVRDDSGLMIYYEY